MGPDARLNGGGYLFFVSLFDEIRIKKAHCVKKIVYVDMDNVLVDFPSGIKRLDEKLRESYKGNYDDVPGIFALMDPVPGAIEAYHWLCDHFDTYILSTAPWKNPSAWQDKLLWVQKHLGDIAYKRLILTHHKDLQQGDFLIDDRPNNGVEKFSGEWIRFGSGDFPDWEHVIRYLKDRA